MFKQIFDVAVETKKICGEIETIQGKVKNGDSYYDIPEALRLYKRLSCYGLTRSEIVNVVDEIGKQYAEGKVPAIIVKEIAR